MVHKVLRHCHRTLLNIPKMIMIIIKMTIAMVIIVTVAILFMIMLIYDNLSRKHEINFHLLFCDGRELVSSKVSS